MQTWSMYCPITLVVEKVREFGLNKWKRGMESLNAEYGLTRQDLDELFQARKYIFS